MESIELTDNLNDMGFEYSWNLSINPLLNRIEFFKKHNPKDLAEFFVKHKKLNWYQYKKDWYGKTELFELVSSELVSDLILNYHKKLSDELWYKVVKTAIDRQIITTKFVLHTLSYFSNNPPLIDLDPYKLLKGLKPLIKPNQIYSDEHTNILERNSTLPLIYFTVLNDKITKKKAEEIFEDFDTDGATFLGIEAQNFLIDNNKYIKQLIIDNDLLSEYPDKTVRDVFMF